MYNISAATAPSPSTPSLALTALSVRSSASAMYASPPCASLPTEDADHSQQVLCDFRSNQRHCDGFHDVAPICEQFLTDKGCKYRTESDHPWFPNSHDFELRRCMGVMIEPHRLGLYGVKHL